MADFDWKKLVAGIAPVIGTALGGPLAGAAISQLGAVLLGNADASETDVAAAVSSGKLTGEQIVAMKKADQDFQARMRELDIDVLKLNQAADDAVMHDVQDARAKQIATKDNMPQIITGIAFTIYVLEFIFFASGNMPADEFTKALITRAFGTVDGILLTCVAYFVGSSRGSKSASETVRKIAESKTP